MHEIVANDQRPMMVIFLAFFIISFQSLGMIKRLEYFWFSSNSSPEAKDCLDKNNCTVDYCNNTACTETCKPCMIGKNNCKMDAKRLQDSLD